MTYLDRESYGKLVAKRRTAYIGVSLATLKDKTDRTLTLGMNSNGAALHVYIKDSVLYTHEYLEVPDGNPVTVTCLCGIVSPAALSPTFYAIPSATDAEFAELMLILNHPLDLAGYDTSVNNVKQNKNGYFGLIWSME